MKKHRSELVGGLGVIWDGNFLYEAVPNANFHLPYLPAEIAQGIRSIGYRLHGAKSGLGGNQPPQ